MGTAVPAVTVADVARWAMYMLPLIRRLRRNDEPIAILPTRVAFCDVSTVNAVDPFVAAVIAPFEDAIVTLDVPLEIDVPPPPPAGVAHVPSPRQKVVEDAPVPLLRFVTGRLVMPWIVLELVQTAIWLAVGVPLLETLPPPADATQVVTPVPSVCKM